MFSACCCCLNTAQATAVATMPCQVYDQILSLLKTGKRDGIQRVMSPCWTGIGIPVGILLDDLIYANLNGFILKAAVAPIFVYPELGGCHCLSVRDLSQVKAEFLVVPSVVGEVLVPFNCEKKNWM